MYENISLCVLLTGHFLSPGILILSEPSFTWTADCDLDPARLLHVHVGIPHNGENLCLFQDEVSYDCIFFSIPEWERRVEFFPNEAVPDIRTHPTWVTLAGERPRSVVPRDTSFILKNCLSGLSTLPVRNPSAFVSGGLSEYIDEWANILNDSSERCFSTRVFPSF